MSETQKISKAEQELFDGLRNPDYTSFVLLAITQNGKPTNAICNVTKKGEQYMIQPLYVQVTDEMLDTLKCPDGEIPK